MSISNNFNTVYGIKPDAPSPDIASPTITPVTPKDTESSLRSNFLKQYPTNTQPPAPTPTPTPTPAPTPSVPPVKSWDSMNWWEKAKATVKELPTGIVETGKGILNLGKGIIQGTARSGATLGLSAMEPITGVNKMEAQPGLAGTVQKTMFGEEPISTFGEQAKSASTWLKEKGVNVSPIETLPAIVGLTVLDFTGAGGEKSAIKVIAKLKNEGEIANVLSKIGVAEDLIAPYAKKLAGISDERVVKETLDHISDIQKTTKVGGTAIGELPSIVKPKTTEAVLPKVIPETPIAKIPSPQEIVSNKARMGFLSQSDNIPEMIKQHGDFSVVIKDVNGQRGIMSASDFAKLQDNPAFTDRIRDVWIGMKPIPKELKYGTPEMIKYIETGREVAPALKKPELDEGFMSELQVDKMLKEPTRKAIQAEVLKSIEGVKLTNNSTVSTQGKEKFVSMITDNNIRGLLKENGIKEINIEPPYKFGLSEQGHIIRGKKVINISADATNPTDTILHELGHAKFENASKAEKARLIELAKNTQDPAMQGYKKLRAWEEIIADSYYKKPEFSGGSLPNIIPATSHLTSRPNGSIMEGVNLPKFKAIQFVSPNVKENLSHAEVLKNMKSPEYQAAYDNVSSVYSKDGLIGEVKKGRGDWGDGREETFIKKVTNDVPDDKRIYSLSKNSKSLVQKDAIDFKIDPAAKDELFVINPSGKSIEEVAKLLDAEGIKFKTLGDDELYVVNSGEYFDTEMAKKMEEFANNNNLDINGYNGVATFVTKSEDRNAAQKIYDNIINNYEKKYGILNEQTSALQGDTIPGKPLQGKGSRATQEEAQKAIGGAEAGTPQASQEINPEDYKSLFQQMEQIRKTSEPDTYEKLAQKVQDAMQSSTSKVTAHSILKEFKKLKGMGSDRTIINDALKKGKEFGSKERKFITSVKEQFPKVEKAAGQYIPRSTDELSVKAKNLIHDDIATAENMARTGTDENAVATASELIKHYSNKAEMAADNIAKNAYYDKAADIANTIAPKLTEQGRAVQAASILGRLTPEGQVRFAAGLINRYNENIAKSGGETLLKKKIPDLTGEQAGKILEEMKAIEQMPDGIDKSLRFKKLQEYVTSLVPSGIIDKVIAVWKAGLLTGLKTSGLNIFSNAAHYAAEIVKDIPATMVDSVASLFTGKRTIGFTPGGVKGLKEGFDKGWQYLKTGFDERSLEIKLDYKRVNFGEGKVAKAIQKYEETVFRFLGSQDQPFYYGAKARSIQSQAIAESINKGLKGNEAKTFIDNLVSNPTEEILKNAVQDAEAAVFQNQTALSKVAGGVQRLAGGLGQIVLPFVRTPSAIAMQIINYTPVGSIKPIWDLVMKKNFNQRVFSQAMGRSITGTAVLALGALLYRKGMVTLEYPVTEKEQKLWELEGRTKNSILINGKWRSLQILGPIGNVLAVGGDFQRGLQQTGSLAGAMSQSVFGGWASFQQNTFLQGIDQVITASQDPQNKGMAYVSSQFASIIPTISADIAKSMDAKERRVRSDSMWEKLIARVPLMRETLQPSVNVLGEDRNRVGNILEVMADPTRPSKENKDPLIAEFRRLWDRGYKASPALLGDKNGYDSLTPEQNTHLWEKAGTIASSKLHNLIKMEEYKQLPADEKEKVINDIVSKSNTYARAEMVLEVTDGLEGEALKNKLSELKTSKLLTQDVFTAWAQLR